MAMHVRARLAVAIGFFIRDHHTNYTVFVNTTSRMIVRRLRYLHSIARSELACCASWPTVLAGL